MERKPLGLLPNPEKNLEYHRQHFLTRELIKCEDEGVTVATGRNPIGQDYAYVLTKLEEEIFKPKRFTQVVYLERTIPYSRTSAVIVGEGPFGEKYAYAEMTVDPKHRTGYYTDRRHKTFDSSSDRRDIIDLYTGKIYEDYEYGTPLGESLRLIKSLEDLNEMRVLAGLEELDEHPESGNSAGS